MKYVVVDLEMNPIHKQYVNERMICKMETIQIGAVILDDNYSEIGSFSTLIKPEYNSVIEERYKNLTGIHTSMVQNAPVFKDALHVFFQWILNYEDEVKIYTWSESDLNQLLDEMDLKEIELLDKEDHLIDCFIDFQKEFDDILGFKRQLSLVDALQYADISFEGMQHNALYDARNTATLLSLVKDENKKNTKLQGIIDMVSPTLDKPTLGDLFDFSQLIL